MTKEKMWEKLMEMGTSEETLRVVTCINGYTTEVMQEILYVEYGYTDFEQL